MTMLVLNLVVIVASFITTFCAVFAIAKGK